MLRVLLTLLAACTVEVPQPSPPPLPIGFQLHASDLIVGQPVTLTATGVTPGVTVHFVHGRPGMSAPLPQLGGDTLGLASVQALGEAVADSSGTAIWTAPSLPHLQPRVVAIQAVAEEASGPTGSNVVDRTPIGGACQTQFDPSTFTQLARTAPKTPPWAFQTATWGQWDDQTQPFRCATDLADAQAHADTGHYASFGYVRTGVERVTPEFYELEMADPNTGAPGVFRNTRCDWWDGTVLAGAPFASTAELQRFASYDWWIDHNNISGFKVLGAVSTPGDLDYVEMCTVETVYGDFGVLDEFTLISWVWGIDRSTGEVVDFDPREVGQTSAP